MLNHALELFVKTTSDVNGIHDARRPNHLQRIPCAFCTKLCAPCDPQKPFVESLVRFRGFEKRLPLDDDEMKQTELEN